MREFLPRRLSFAAVSRKSADECYYSAGEESKESASFSCINLPKWARDVLGEF